MKSKKAKSQSRRVFPTRPVPGWGRPYRVGVFLCISVCASVSSLEADMHLLSLVSHNRPLLIAMEIKTDRITAETSPDPRQRVLDVLRNRQPLGK